MKKNEYRAPIALARAVESIRPICTSVTTAGTGGDVDSGTPIDDGGEASRQSGTVWGEE